jgi:hypothetical protein
MCDPRSFRNGDASEYFGQVKYDARINISMDKSKKFVTSLSLNSSNDYKLFGGRIHFGDHLRSIAMELKRYSGSF